MVSYGSAGGHQRTEAEVYASQVLEEEGGLEGSLWEVKAGAGGGSGGLNWSIQSKKNKVWVSSLGVLSKGRTQRRPGGNGGMLLTRAAGGSFQELPCR